jgi:peptidoglycan hydrolase CwlO-like protein
MSLVVFLLILNTVVHLSKSRLLGALDDQLQEQEATANILKAEVTSLKSLPGEVRELSERLSEAENLIERVEAELKEFKKRQQPEEKKPPPSEEDKAQPGVVKPSKS